MRYECGGGGTTIMQCVKKSYFQAIILFELTTHFSARFSRDDDVFSSVKNLLNF